jgi:hypothetical protein
MWTISSLIFKSGLLHIPERKFEIIIDKELSHTIFGVVYVTRPRELFKFLKIKKEQTVTPLITDYYLCI